MKSKKNFIIMFVVISCIFMAIVDLVIQPSYIIKSLIKNLVFFIVPIFLFKYFEIQLFDNFRLNKRGLLKLCALGLSVYVITMFSYFIAKNVFDFKDVVGTLMINHSIKSNYYIYVALYISFGNSLLEEFFFRLIGCIKLGEYSSKKFAYIFSSLLFALYHIGMIGRSFPISLTIISVICLFILGVIFNHVNEKNKNIFNSWFVHMFVDFAVMTIGYINM